MQTSALKKPSPAELAAYTIGERDIRPWGSYIVTDVGTTASGEEYCEKEITVTSGQILSLQSHEHRRERWTVLKGTLTVVLNDNVVTLKEGRSIDIPQGALHCMANLHNEDCVVHERQEGMCREEDIVRYVDAYGRGTGPVQDARMQNSITVYKDIMGQIQPAVAA